jgi:hypothetical protein
MVEHGQHPDPAAHPPRYETSDADVRAIGRYGIGLFVLLLLAFGLMWAMHFLLEKQPVELDQKPTVMEMERMLPPLPRLQVNQGGDLAEFREHERQILTTYGREKNSGAVRIPIDRAMDIIAHRGLAAAKPAPAPKPAAPKPAAGGKQ